MLENYIYFLKNHPSRAFWSALGVVLLGVLLVCFGFFFLNSKATFLTRKITTHKLKEQKH